MDIPPPAGCPHPGAEGFDKSKASADPSGCPDPLGQGPSRSPGGRKGWCLFLLILQNVWCALPLGEYIGDVQESRNIAGKLKTAVKDAE